MARAAAAENTASSEVPPMPEGSAPAAPLMIIWHGRDGRNGKDKSIFATHSEVALQVVSDESMKKGLKSSDGKVFKLMPGVNTNVDPREWEIVKKYSGTQKQLAAGNLEVLSVDVSESLMAIPEERAASEFARYTIDKNLLGRWIASEERASVKKALAVHLAELSQRPVQS